jgi:hypothetical protein
VSTSVPRIALPVSGHVMLDEPELGALLVVPASDFLSPAAPVFGVSGASLVVPASDFLSPVAPGFGVSGVDPMLSVSITGTPAQVLLPRQAYYRKRLRNVTVEQLNILICNVRHAITQLHLKLAHHISRSHYSGLVQSKYN